MNPLEYLLLQLRLEGKVVVDDDRLRQVEAVPGEEMPLMVIAQLAGGQVVAYYDESLSPDLYAELAEQIQKLTFPTIEPLLGVLKKRSIGFDMGHYKTYQFPVSVKAASQETVKCLSRSDALVQRFGFGTFAENVYAVERGGKIVSACVSTRENRQCAEAWVYTDEPCRRRGFAQQVVRAWAQAVLASGKVPFYSHQRENHASANLAKGMGLQPLFEEIAISYMNV